MSNTIILLTACVKPNGMTFTKLQDNKERLNQYKKALKWYLENTSEKIVLVENTLTDFSNDFISYIKNERLEYITFDGNNYNRNLGKGYGEAMILKTALAKSQFIKEYSSILKITGRIILKNINDLVKRCKDTKTVYANTLLLNGKCVSLSVAFIAPKKFINDYFLGGINQLNDTTGYYFEHLLYESSLKWSRDCGQMIDFKVPLILDGESGSTGEKYLRNHHFISLKAFIKYFAHKHLIYVNHFL